MDTGRKKLRIILLAAALVVSVFLAFVTDQAVFLCADHPRLDPDEHVIFSDGNEAYNIFGCRIEKGKVIVTGWDPQFVVYTGYDEISVVHILLSEPAAQDISLQVFYVPIMETLSEENSVYVTIPRGAVEERIPIPDGVYSSFRFDFEQDVSLFGIYTGNKAETVFTYTRNTTRIIFIAAELFLLFCILIFTLTKKKEMPEAAGSAPDRQGIIAAIRRRPFWAVLSCSLFLSLTVILFQPLSYTYVHLKGFPFEDIWPEQLLLAAGAALVLSCLALLLPAAAGRIAASVFLGAGIAFLAQSLLLNEERPLAMDSSWPMEMLNIFVWFGVVLIAAAACYSGEKGRTVQKAMCLIAVILIAAQAVNFTILGTTTDEVYLHEVYYREKSYIGDPKSGDVLNISMSRGMPFFLKDSFEEYRPEDFPE